MSEFYQRAYDRHTRQIAAVYGVIGRYSVNATPEVAAVLDAVCTALDVSDELRCALRLPPRGEVAGDE